MFQLITSQVGNQFKPKDIKTSGLIFKLITRYTVIFLVISSLVISCKQYFGDPIECITTSQYKSQFEIFCWTHGTYINERLLLDKSEIGKHVVNHGIGEDKEGDTYIYQYYYQWVVPILLLEALIFYFPKLLWRSWENGRMQTICSKINCPYMDDDWDSKHKIRILEFMRQVTAKCHRIYALKYFFCEALSCFAVLINMCIFHLVFNNFWTNFYETIKSLFSNDFEEYARSAAFVFPKQAKCEMFYFGPSQTAVKLDALCILPHNVINEKIFVFLYMWMLILLGLSIVKLLHNMCLLISLAYRTKSLERMTSTSLSNKVTKKCDIGSWFMFNLLTKNLDDVLVNDLLTDLFKNNCSFE
ncbi:unnamed protein product [Diamesa serratosioi]